MGYKWIVWGVVLVGDTLHTFPPDIGQGVNTGLMDVASLDHVLRLDSHDEGGDLGRRSKEGSGAGNHIGVAE